MDNKIYLAHEGTDFKFSEMEFGAAFPAMWGFSKSDGQGGKPPEDAGTLYVTIGWKGCEIYEYGLTVKFTLQDLIEEHIASAGGSDGLICEDHKDDAKKIITRLRDAADALEKKLSK